LLFLEHHNGRAAAAFEQRSTSAYAQASSTE